MPEGTKRIVEELAVAGNDILKLSAAVIQMKESTCPVKILTEPARRVKQTALIFQSLGVEGVVRDPLGLVVIPIVATSSRNHSLPKVLDTFRGLAPIHPRLEQHIRDLRIRNLAWSQISPALFRYV